MKGMRPTKVKTTGSALTGFAKMLLFLVLMAVFGLGAAAQIPVAVTITSIDQEPSVVGQGYYVRFQVVRTDSNPNGYLLNGTMTVVDGEGNSCSRTMTTANGDGWQWGCTLTTYTAGVKTLTATFVPANPAQFGGDSDTASHTVNPADTTTAVVSSGSPSVYGQPVTFTATVSVVSPGGGTPTGTVAFYAGTTLLGSASSTTTNVVSFTTDQLSVGTHSITAVYEGNVNYNGSTSPAISQVVTKRQTTTIVFGSDTPLVVGDTATCTVTVSDISPGTPFVPTGNVSVSVSPSGAGTLSGGSHNLVASDAGQYEFTYTPTSAATTPHTFTATYAGDSIHDGSSGTFDQAIIKRALEMEMTLSLGTAYVLQPVTVSIHMEDDTTAGTPGSLSGVEITLDDGGKNGTFSDDSPTLDGNGNCTVTYTPGAYDAGTGLATTTITASYAGSNTYAAKQVIDQLAVQLRPTETTVSFATSQGILVNESTTFTVTVTDKAGPTPEVVTPNGTISITKSLSPTSEGHIGFSSASTTSTTQTWNYTYVRVALDSEGGDFDQLDCTYAPNDGIHTGSTGSYGKSISRRPTNTTITNPMATATGVSYTVQVAEDPSNAGTPTIPLGTFIEKDGISLTELPVQPNSAAPGPQNVVKTLADPDYTLMVNVTVTYKPNDRVHISSTASETINRADYIKVDPPTDPSNDGSDCTDGCGDGGTNVEQIIYNLNASIVGLHAVQMGLDAAATIASIFPDPVWTAGFGFESGSEVPVKDIVIAIIDGVNQLLEVAIVAMETDLDGDGLPDVVEQNTTHTDYTKIDTDGDGMDDHDEVDSAGGYYGGTRRPDPNNPDSDGDGLTDGDEGDIYQTNFCVADTDCDVLTDGEEVGTWSLTDTRDHLDPLMQDTDGDGLNDYVEYAPGDLATSTSDTTYSPYGNDDDSDGDGLQDGRESSNGDAVWDYTQLGSTGTTGSGETHLCLADTDGDGLLDGVEESLFGRGGVNVHSTLGTITTPALDDDSDDDGLSDYEEQVITQTDPLNWDSDGDTLSDANELIATGGAWPARTFTQVSDPLDPDTDDDGLRDDVEYSGTGLGTSQGLGGEGDTICPYVNDDDSDDDGLQDGTESWNGDATITTGVIGDSATQAPVTPSGETDFCLPDTDGDGLTDGEEVALLGGLPVDGTNGFTPVTPKGVSTVFGVDGAPLTPTIAPLDDDSDNDGLSDYEEINVTGTDPLDQDSDNDTLSDANELIATGGTWPHRSFIQVSDPLDPDTDDDDIPDQNEYPGSGLGTSRGLGGTPDNICPYVNDDDSDNDGLQDGVEDANHDGTWGVGGSGIVIGSFGTQSSKSVDYWETDPCNPDTDGDGIRDGEEANLIGGGPIGGRPNPIPGFYTVTPEGRSIVMPVGTSYGAEIDAPFTFSPSPGPAIGATVPALDVDSDNDGLSDYEEVNVTGTDPLDADTDNDTLMDSDELIATGGIAGATPKRTFDQESDPLDINTDDDYLFDPIEGTCGDRVYTGTGLSTLNGAIGGTRDLLCPLVNQADSDNDGVEDGAVIPISRQGPGLVYSYTFIEGFHDVEAADIQAPGTVRTVVTPATGEQDDDLVCNVCDPDSDGDGLTDGQEVGLGTDPQDWDTDDDGRNDWHEQTGGGPIPTDPFDPDTDDDGLLDSAEVFGSNPTNPTNADTDGDGLGDGGAGTPYMVSGHPTIVVNPIIKACSTPGLIDCGAGTVRAGSPDGIGDHPNRLGIGEDQNGNGAWDAGETDPNQYDTDGDAVADGIERLAFSTSRQSLIPTVDLFGRPILVNYPEANNVKVDCGCMDPLIADTDNDGLSDGYEDRNHDGNFDFLPSEFDHQDPLPGPPIPYPTETNPCEADTDHDGLTDFEERMQRQPLDFYPPLPVDNDNDGAVDEDPVDGIDNDYDGLIDEDPSEGPIELTFNPTNPLDHDTDNDRILDGPEVYWVCTAITCSQLDNDIDGLINEDPIDGQDNDGDGLIDEDPVDFTVRSISMLDPTDRDSDSDGFIDGLDDDPCNSDCIPVLAEVSAFPVDTDGDGFSDLDEKMADTNPNDPDSHPTAYCRVDLDFDGEIDDAMWLEPVICCGLASSVVIDTDFNGLVDARVRVVEPRDVRRGDFDEDGAEDDLRYTILYTFSNYRATQPRVTATIDDYDSDMIIDRVVVEQR